ATSADAFPRRAEPPCLDGHDVHEFRARTDASELARHAGPSFQLLRHECHWPTLAAYRHPLAVPVLQSLADWLASEVPRVLPKSKIGEAELPRAKTRSFVAEGPEPRLKAR